MEGLRLSSSAGPESESLLGEQLASLHTIKSPDGRFGNDGDNFIGATPQPNPWTESWADFFVTHRLAHQFELAAARGRTFPETERTLDLAHRHLDALAIRPVQLHGDLWRGNVGFADDEPVLFDPAAYYGDRETDIAFTQMFGGFPSAFYAAYRRIHPEPEAIRAEIYNLYHTLNHFNLFGGGYASDAEAMMRSILCAL